MPRSSCILLGLLFALGMGSSAAEDLPKQYPERSIKILVGFAAGGGTDVAARIVAQKLTETIGQPVVVENRPGASGMIATETVAKSGADGYTLMVGTQTTLAVAPALYRKFSIDATRDFVGVAKAGISPLVLVVHPSVPARSVIDLIALAKASPGTINFGSGGLGTTPHMAGELFSIQAGIKMVHVAYRGEAPAINDLLGVLFVRRLNTEVTQLVTQPDVRQQFADLGMTIDAGTPDALDAYIKSEMLKWSKVIKEADIRAPD